MGDVVFETMYGASLAPVMLTVMVCDAVLSADQTVRASVAGWPSMSLLRRRAEGRLWQERSEAATVRRFTGGQPASAKGRFALARVLLAEGDRDGAGRQVQVWAPQLLGALATGGCG
jgi:hypothetical protein